MNNLSFKKLNMNVQYPSLNPPNFSGPAASLEIGIESKRDCEKESVPDIERYCTIRSKKRNWRDFASHRSFEMRM
jgi:hypothetical protein